MTHLAHFFVGDTVKQRAQLTHFVPDLLVGIVMHRITHLAGQQTDDLPVALHVASGIDRLAKTLESAIGAGEYPAVLAPGRCGQQHVRHFRRFGHEDILHHHEIEGLEPAAHQAQIGFGLKRIFAHDVIGFHFAFQRQMRDFGNAHAYLIVHFVDVDSPRVSKFLPHFGIGDILIAREHVRQHAHITRTLHVVLTANRADANGRATEISGQ
ncbi:hypothetical protein D3C78_826250 [compost metagenome]